MMRLSSNTRTVTNADGGVMLDLRKGKLFRLNSTGAVILELLARGGTEESIAAELSRLCGVDCALASSDVHAFLAVLRSHGLLDEQD